MNLDAVWLAIGLVLVLEGLFPFASPQAWRRLFTQLLQMRDGQIRFFGVCSILAGLGLIWALLP
ncbi:DUF2065 domain-containing protein [Rhodoferax sp. OV413]|uniref:DUF2065 domain-containing protein n=1 Tax=Rhodoferax sp. OV413 TaxID=1855285 RepID=UPI0025F89DA6|nr:DUF2065 domain-containing protein [Rhodoferax sp. OV413]